MTQLLSIEWLKVRKYRTFWILIGFFVLLLPLWNYGISKGVVNIGGKDNISILNQSFTFQYIWINLGYWGSLFVAFISVLTIILTTNEYSFKTSRQNIIDGLTRQQFYHSKWLLIFILSILTTVYVFITGLAFGIAASDMGNFPGNLKPLFYVFILSLNYYGFGLLLALLLKRSGLAIGMFFLYAMFLESLIKGLINWGTKSEAGNFFPLQASDELLPFPLTEMLKTVTGIEQNISDWTYVLASIAWILIYYLIGRYRILKSDW